MNRDELREVFRNAAREGRNEIILSYEKFSDEDWASVFGSSDFPKLPVLQELWLSKTSVSDEGLDRLANAIEADKLPALQKLVLNDTCVGDKGLSRLVDAIEADKLSALKWLGLSSTRVNDEGIGRLASAIKAGKLSTLQLFGLYNTSVGDKALGRLAGAIKVGKLSTLQILSLDMTDVGNKGLSRLVNALKANNLPALKWLTLHGTRVGDEGLGRLADVIEADKLPALRLLGLSSTIITSIDPAVLASGNPQQIVAALREGVTLPEARVVMLGMGNVGKTWLFRRCFKDEVVDRKEERKRTLDIDQIRTTDIRWKPRIQQTGADELQEITPHVWDFGGQTVLHGVHEPFLDSGERTGGGRTVYVLVLAANRSRQQAFDDNGQEQGNRLDYWLRTIHHFAGENAPVVIAITQCDKVAPGDARKLDCADGDTPLSEWKLDTFREQFGAWVTQVVDNCSACDAATSIGPLRAAISTALGQLSALKDGARVPRGIMRMKQKVEEEIDRKALVPVETFREWCEEAGISAADEQDSTLRILDRLGSVFYFGLTPSEQQLKDENPERYFAELPPGQRRLYERDTDSSLQQYVVNPRWLKYPLYAVIRKSEKMPWQTQSDVDEAVAEGEQELKRGEPKFESHEHGQLVMRAMLKRTELCHKATHRGYLFPRGLDAGGPYGVENWQPRAVYRWKFFPEAAFHRFMVHMHDRGDVVRDTNDQFQHWRQTVLIEHIVNTRVAIAAAPEQGTIEVCLDPTSANKDGFQRTCENLRDLFVKDFIKREPVAEEQGTSDEGSEGTGVEAWDGDTDIESEGNQIDPCDEVKLLEEQTPELDIHNTQEWVLQEEVKKRDHVTINSLNKMRTASQGGQKNSNGTFGCDKAKRRWRKTDPKSKSVYYYVPSLLSEK